MAEAERTQISIVVTLTPEQRERLACAILGILMEMGIQPESCGSWAISDIEPALIEVDDGSDLQTG